MFHVWLVLLVGAVVVVAIVVIGLIVAGVVVLRCVSFDDCEA